MKSKDAVFLLARLITARDRIDQAVERLKKAGARPAAPTEVAQNVAFAQHELRLAGIKLAKLLTE